MILIVQGLSWTIILLPKNGSGSTWHQAAVFSFVVAAWSPAHEEIEVVYGQ
jgi:hypothetical protein